MSEVYIFDVLRILRGKGKFFGVLYEVKFIDFLVIVFIVLKERN